jgi:hypothetical protein
MIATPLRRAGMTLLLAAASPLVPSPAVAAPPNAPGRPEIMTTAHQDVLPRLGALKGKPVDPRFQEPAKDKRRVPYEDPVDFAGDKVAQTSHQGKPGSGGGGTPAPALGMEGIGNGFTGPQGSFLIQYAPPDTTGAVGATQYVQWVNASFAVFSKSTGAPVYGPVAGNTLFTGFGGACETSNDGDPVVQYDKLADRWVLMQFAVPSGGPYYQCIAVSQTSDATGAYNRYAFQYSGFNDYPKAGVWPDAYYLTYNMFTPNTFGGAKVCAMERAKMLAGLPATQQCFQLSTAYGGLLPADLDGKTAPPDGAPNYIVNLGTSRLNLWKFHVDWANPAASTLSGPSVIPVAAFAAACGGGTCVPQAGTNQKLDSLADRIMYRLAYRNFGDHEALLVNHAVTYNNNSATRWYELRDLATTPTVYQQSTYAPDATSRWMGSVAMDKMGNIALGYSASSGAIKPAIRFATRLQGDPLNVLFNETAIVQGGGAQLRLSRWGDYSHMSVDPADDCTFWYTSQYLKADGRFNWSTRIHSFKMGSCI